MTLNKSTLENQFDALDRRIIKELSDNSRIVFSQLAEKLNVSNSLVHQRVKKLEESGVFVKPIYQLDEMVLGYETSAFIQIMVTHVDYLDKVIEALKKIPEVVECFNVAGRYAIMVKIFTINNAHLRDILYDRIQTIKGVEATNTIFCFKTQFRRAPHVE